MYQLATRQDEDRRRSPWRLAGTIVVLMATVVGTTAAPSFAAAQDHRACDARDTLCVSECGRARMAIMRSEAAVEAAPQWRDLARTAPFLHFTEVVATDAAAHCGEPYGANEALWHIYEAGLGNHLFPVVGGTEARCAGLRTNVEGRARAVFSSEVWSKVEGTAELAALSKQVLDMSGIACPLQ